MRRPIYTIILLVLAGTLIASSAFAGAKIKINDESTFDLGFRIQFLGISSQTDLDGDGKWDNTQDFKVRRARFRLKGSINKWADGFLQTDISSASGGSGRDMRVIDAYVNLKADPWAQFFTGINMVPSSRQNLTSSGALMAIDRPGLNYKTLSWGARSLYAFNNSTIGTTDSGIRGEEDVRDAGVTLFGSGTVGDDIHMKYYAGVYDGIQMSGMDDERFAGRVQFNIFDAEGGYFNSSTYLGKKKTVGVGVSMDMQKSVAADTLGEGIDYMLVSGDVFAEFPVGEASVTLEGGLYKLDFDDGVRATSDTTWVSLMASQGSGFYGEAGVLLNERWQPWVEFEQWSSDADGDAGGYSLYRVGLNYYIMGQNANIKVAFESMKSDVMLTSEEDTINSFVIGTYLTY